MTFIHDNFQLYNETAKTLYHQYAKDLPIFDYHCHLSAKEIAEDKKFQNITELWLGGDHYKWRIMRTFGISEELITGKGDDYEKFMAFAQAVPYTIGNPMYHWTHLELKRYFQIEACLTPENAPDVWKQCNQLLNQPDFSAKGLIRQSNVEVICTTDDPVDDLQHHLAIQEDTTFQTRVLPTFRPDKGINIQLPTFLPWIRTLSEVVGKPIESIKDLLVALEQRLDYFHQVGCRLSDHALDEVVYTSLLTVGQALTSKQTKQQASIEPLSLLEEQVNALFQKALKGEMLNTQEICLYKSYMLHFFGKQYSKRKWTMQLHIGALRNNNRRMHEKLGPDTGFDSIHDSTFAPALSALLNDLDSFNQLPKTILYVLNPRDNYVIGTMIGNFQGGGIPGKIQFGSGWWFCDQKEGMMDQMKSLASLGLISQFVGMLTDSRSFISYTRHEYFRRILCNLFGEWIEKGEYPMDIPFVGKMIENICLYNARAYFDLGESTSL